jgi:hypothetical protein
MTHTTRRRDAATESRVRQAAEELDRRVETAAAEAAPAYFFGREDDPAIGMGVLHPLLRSRTHEDEQHPVSDESILPVNGIIFRDLQNGLTLEKIAERYGCDDKMLASRVLKTRRRPVASVPSVDGVQAATLGVFVGFAGLPIARAEGPVPPSNTKLKRLLAEAMLDNAALKDFQPVPPSRPAICDEAATKRTFRHEMMSLRIAQ